MEGYVRHGSGPPARRLEDETSQPTGLREGPYPEPDRLYQSWAEIEKQLQASSCLGMAPMDTLEATWRPLVRFPVQSPHSVGLGLRGTPFSQTLATIDQLRTSGPVLVVARSRGQVDRLLALFGEHNLPAAAWASKHWSALSQKSGSQKHPLYVLQGELSAGFVSAEGRLAIVTEEELFAKGMRHRPAPKTKTATFLSSLDDLKVGDLIVHVQHDISRYQALSRLYV